MNRYKFDNEVKARERAIEQLIKSAKKFSPTGKQVLMSFTTDPYNPLNKKLKLTNEALKIFLKYKIPVSILTKSGLAALEDLEIIKYFGSNIKVGASLTFDNDHDSHRIERGAALPSERMTMLQLFHENQVQTWVSFEPIIQPEQTIHLLEQTIPFVDEYRLGKLSGDSTQRSWKNFLTRTVAIMRTNNKKFYIKETLAKEAPKNLLQPHEVDMDFNNLKGWNE
jgi:DNA repair photolyase